MSSTSIDDLAWNELPIVAKQNGEVSVWKAWKRSIAAFADPRLWRSTEAFPEYFERLTSDAWGMAGYGVIVVDFDARQVLSINDFSTPMSLYLPGFGLGQAPGDPSLPALMRLLSEPEQWPNVTLRVGTPSVVPGVLRALFKNSGTFHEVTLNQALPSGATPQQALNALTLDRLGRTRVAGSSCVFFKGTYHPEGWTQHADVGPGLPEGTLGALLALERAGFPPPQWSGFDEQVSQGEELPITHEDLAEPVEDFDDAQRREQAQVYLALKRRWTAPSIEAGRPSSGPR